MYTYKISTRFFIQATIGLLVHFDESLLKTETKQIAERLLHACKVHSLKELGDNLGISKQAIQNGLKNGIPSSWLVKICMEHDVSLNWLITGNVTKHITPNETQTAKQEKSLYIQRIPVTTEPSSGEDTSPISPPEPFPTHWLPESITSDKLGLFVMPDQALDPLIREGNQVIIDLSQNKPTLIIDGKIYLFRQHGVYKLRRLLLLGDTLMITSLNYNLFPNYQPTLKSITLMGQAIWGGGKLF